jgi:Zn-finger nucleic acid-binding protein
MQCPIDGTQLLMTDRSGVEIDYCPQCRGVWLDRGELDKIIERGNSSSTPREVARFRDDGRDDNRHRDLSQSDSDGKPYKKKRREGFLGELFDF